MNDHSAQRLRFIRFSLVGLLGAALQLVLFSVLMKCVRMPVVAASAIAVEIAVLHNFVWHERFTWPDRRAKRFRQIAIRLWRFHAGNGFVSLLGNSALTYFLVCLCQAPALGSAIGAIALCSVANFFLADRWVYARSGGTHLQQPFPIIEESANEL